MKASNLEASEQPNMIALCTVMLTFATLAVLLRELYAKWKRASDRQTTQRGRPYIQNSADNNKRFIRMRTQPRDGKALYWSRSEELDLEGELGRSVSGSLVGLDIQQSAERIGV